MKRVIAHLVRQNDRAGSFKAMLAEYEQLPPKGTDLSIDYWTVDFAASMRLAAEIVQSWPDGGGVATAMRESESVDDFRGRLAALAVDLAQDPDECSHLNYQLISKVVDDIERLRQAWWFKRSASADSGGWRSGRDELVAGAKAVIGNRAFTTVLTEADVFSALREQVRASGTTEFQRALAYATDLTSLRSAVDIADDDLIDIDARQAAQRAEAQRRHQVVNICGDEFDASEDNREQFWQFLKERVKYEELSAAQPLDLRRTAGLLPMKAPKVRGDAPTVQKKPAKQTQRQPKAVDELIGLAGEIHVFELLKLRYGADAITASSWVSENSRYVFEDNAIDDGMGCDFAFAVGGRTYRVEVKATAGDDDSFTLGSSEITLAMKLASQKKSRRGTFILVHVKKALSPQPEAIVLPNPYDPKQSAVFTIEEADARVRYRVRP